MTFSHSKVTYVADWKLHLITRYQWQIARQQAQLLSVLSVDSLSLACKSDSFGLSLGVATRVSRPAPLRLIGTQFKKPSHVWFGECLCYSLGLAGWKVAWLFMFESVWSCLLLLKLNLTCGYRGTRSVISDNGLSGIMSAVDLACCCLWFDVQEVCLGVGTTIFLNCWRINISGLNKNNKTKKQWFNIYFKFSNGYGLYINTALYLLFTKHRL